LHLKTSTYNLNPEFVSALLALAVGNGVSNQSKFKFSRINSQVSHFLKLFVFQKEKANQILWMFLWKTFCPKAKHVSAPKQRSEFGVRLVYLFKGATAAIAYSPSKQQILQIPKIPPPPYLRSQISNLLFSRHFPKKPNCT